MNKAAKPGFLVGFGQEGSDKRCSNPPAGNDFVGISGGRLHCLALRSNGSIAAWGVPMSINPDPNVPGFPKPDYNDVYREVAGGIYHCVALRNNGSLVAWGGCSECYDPSTQAESGYDNPYDMIRDIMTVPEGNDFVHISAGGRYSCALRSNGSVVCWGAVGAAWAYPAGNDFVDVECGNYMAYARKSDGTVVGWGANDFDQLDQLDNYDATAGSPFPSRTIDPWFVPVNATRETNPVITMASGRYIFMGIRSDGILASAGRYGDGVGYPGDCSGNVPDCYKWAWWMWPVNTSLPLDKNPATNPLSTGWIQVAPGGHHNLGLRKVNGKNQMVLWGEGPPGYVDTGSTVPMPGYGGRAPLAWNEEPQAVASGFYHSLAIIHRYPPGDINFDDKIDAGEYSTFVRTWLDNNLQPGDGLVSWYKLDEASGTNAIDSSGNGHNGTLYESTAGAGLSWQPAGGHFAGALKFDGDGPAGDLNSNPRVQIPTAGMSAVDGTVAFWMNLTDPKPANVSGRNSLLYLFGLDGGGNNNVSLFMHTSYYALRLNIGSYTYNNNAYYTFTRGNWYHVAITWNNSEFHVYVNGTDIGYPGAVNYSPPTALPSVANIGNKGVSTYITSMHGLIDDVRIYSYALPAGDIAMTNGGALPSAISHCTGLPEMDFDGDCAVGYSDLVEILNNWIGSKP